jgi:hypothetical protein
VVTDSLRVQGLIFNAFEMIGTKPSTVEDSFCVWVHRENILNVRDIRSTYLNTLFKYLALQPAQMSLTKFQSQHELSLTYQGKYT